MSEANTDSTNCYPRRYKSVREMREMTEGYWHPDGKKCPRCRAGLLKNKHGEEWCSHVECEYGLEDNTQAQQRDSGRRNQGEQP